MPKFEGALWRGMVFVVFVVFATPSVPRTTGAELVIPAITEA
jgi:hypothetical protein